MAAKREGDGATPIGVWPIRQLLYRPDRGVVLPRLPWPVRTIERDDGWCDAPHDPAYNLPVKHPYPSSAEHLWREDGLYDLIIVLGYNDAPVVSGAGSAIFMHVARADYAPTEGCVALARDDLLALLGCGTPPSAVRIGPGG